MENLQLWYLIKDALGQLNAHFEPIVEKSCADKNLDLRTWGLLLAAISFEPEDITPGHLMVRVPYTSADAFSERLELASEKEFLEKIGEGGYRLTRYGREITTQLVDDAREYMARVDPLSTEQSERLAQLLDRLVQASLDQPPPPLTWSVRLSYKHMPALRPPMPYIEQTMSCLAAYRDDAHLAAWQESGLSAMALESLTYLWRGEAFSLDDLCLKLDHRGHSCHVYISVLEELRGRGLIQGPDQKVIITGLGRAFRNQVEEDTDRYFFIPWDELMRGEKEELARHLQEMIAGLTSKS